MHRSLVPELRGAHRFLRSQPRPLSSPAQRTLTCQRHQRQSLVQRNDGIRQVTIRSFSSYRRLQSASSGEPPKGDDDTNDAGKASNSGSDPPSLLRNDDFAKKLRQLIQKSEEDLVRWKKWHEQIEQLQQGKVPEGYHLARTRAELPQDLSTSNFNDDKFPVCYSLDKSSLGRILPLPKHISLQQYESGADSTAHQEQAVEQSLPTDQDNTTTPAQSHTSTTSTPQDSRTHADRRRRKAQKQRNVAKHSDKSSTPSSVDSLHGIHIDPEDVSDLSGRQHHRSLVPDWFIENNIRTYGSSSQPVPPNVPLQSDTGAGEQVQIQAQEKPTNLSLKQAYSAPPSGPTPASTPGDERSSSIEPSAPRYTVDKTVSLADGRYFIDASQYKEVLNTLKGRLHRRPQSSGKQGSVPESMNMNHMTILHTAKDADSLLDALVNDLCNSVNADCVRIGIQDLTNMLSGTGMGPSGARKVSKMSYKIYSKIYGPFDQLQESNEREEDNEDDEEEDDDDDGEDENTSHSMPTFDIPISSVVAFPVSKRSTARPSLASGLSKLLGAVPNDAYNSKQFHDMNGMDAFSQVSQVERLANEIVERGIAAGNILHGDASSPQRPLVLHVPIYRALQDHIDSAQLFLGSLIQAADSKSTDSRPIIVVGTDCMRDLDFLKDRSNRVQPTSIFSHMLNRQPTPAPQSASPRAILDEQEAKSFGASTAIVLTTAFPTPESENSLVQDRENTIRDINVRHLHQALSARGFSLKDFQNGFWSRDYTAALSEQDLKILAQGFWPYIHVQRLSAIISGLGESDSPVSEATDIILQSDESKVAWAKHTQVHRSKDDKPAESKVLSTIRSKATPHEKKLMAGVIEPKKITTTFSDIHIPTDTVDTLQMLTSLSLIRPEAFKYGVLKSDRIPGLLLYGPPGTGKTLAAKAVAKESGATMLEVSGADLNDMYVGEGEKNVKALFSLAKKLSPCVVFIDEADAMFSTRASGTRKTGHRELLNQFLKEWDGMSNDSGSAFIMVATNRPMDLDDAVLRRLPRRLLVDLPTEADRQQIISIHLRNEQLDAGVDLQDLAKRTPFYSGSDLKNLAVAAALQAVREENEAAKQWRSQNADVEGKTYVYPEKRVLTQAHFEKALQEISASISEDMSSLRAIKKFDEQYGDRKGRKKRGTKWGFKSASDADKIVDTIKVRS